MCHDSMLILLNLYAHMAFLLTSCLVTSSGVRTSDGDVIGICWNVITQRSSSKQTRTLHCFLIIDFLIKKIHNKISKPRRKYVLQVNKERSKRTARDLQVLPNSRSLGEGTFPEARSDVKRNYKAMILSGEITRDRPQELDLETEIFHNEMKKD